MKITRKQVLNILKYLNKNPEFYFPFGIICQDFTEDDSLYDVDCTEIEYEVFEKNTLLVNFALEENLQDLYPETVKLMAKGFLEKMLFESNLSHVDTNEIKNKIIDCEKFINPYGCEIEDSEKFALNEFLKGKVEAYHEFLQISDKTIKDFIFVTFEGMTFQPNSESDIPDIEKMQVIGFERGFNVNEAFENLKLNLEYLKSTTFDEIIGIELKSKQFHYYNLKKC